MPARVRVSRTGHLLAHPTLTDGTSLPAGGPSFQLRIRWPGHTVVRKAAVNTKGYVRFAMRLPAAAVGQRPTFQLRRGATLDYQAVSSLPVRIRVTR